MKLSLASIQLIDDAPNELMVRLFIHEKLGEGRPTGTLDVTVVGPDVKEISISEIESRAKAIAATLV